MAEEQNAPAPEEVAAPKPKKKLSKWVIMFLAGYLITAVGNFLYLKSTYVPPPPPVVEEKKPVMSIDLGTEEGEASEDTLTSAQVPAQALPPAVAVVDTVPPVDTGRVIAPEPQVAAVQATVPATEPTELAEEKPVPQTQPAKLDSTALRRSIKLAKIVENMPPEDAAKMLEPLTDDMVIDILLRLKQRQAAKIMAEIPSERAAQISRVIMEPIVQREQVRQVP